jgi:hypothetical protein
VEAEIDTGRLLERRPEAAKLGRKVGLAIAGKNSLVVAGLPLQLFEDLHRLW